MRRQEIPLSDMEHWIGREGPWQQLQQQQRQQLLHHYQTTTFLEMCKELQQGQDQIICSISNIFHMYIKYVQ